MPLSSCPKRMEWKCLSAMRMRGCMWTPTAGSRRMWCSSGEKCPRLWVGWPFLISFSSSTPPMKWKSRNGKQPFESTPKRKKKSVTNTVRLALSVWPQVLCPLFVLKMWTDAVSVAHLMFLMQFWKFLLTAYIHSNQIMGWGEKAIEIRSVETGHLDGVFMHKRAQRLKFLCERNDKVNPFQLCFSVCILRDLQVPVKPSFFLDAAESQLY